MAEWKKVIVSGSTADLAGLTLSGAVNAGTDTDKFLVLDSSGNVDFRTGTEVLSDIGAGTGAGDITRVNITAGDGLSGTVDTTTGDHTQTLAVDATVLRTTGDAVVSGSAQISLGGDLSGTANSATVAKVQGVALTSGEATQLANIGATTISSTQWGYLGVMNQNVRTTDTVTFGNATITTDLTVGGDLVVQGTTTELQVTNLNIEDQFILLNSGSTGADTGIIFGGSGGVAQEGSTLYHDNEQSRLVYVDGNVRHDATGVVYTTGGYLTVAYDVDDGQTAVDAVGNIKIDGGDAFIYV